MIAKCSTIPHLVPFAQALEAPRVPPRPAVRLTAICASSKRPDPDRDNRRRRGNSGRNTESNGENGQAQWDKGIAAEISGREAPEDMLYKVPRSEQQVKSSWPSPDDQQFKEEPSRAASSSEQKTVDFQNDIKKWAAEPVDDRRVMPSTEGETVDLDETVGGQAGRYEVEDLKRTDPKKGQRQESRMEELKHELLTASAGLDRGLSATGLQAQRVDEIVKLMEQVGGGVTLSWLAAGKERSSMEDLGGVWRLVYSSAFLNGNLGGSRPGPPVGLFPFTLGPIYQRIDTKDNTLDNIVQLLFPSPPLPFVTEAPSLRGCLRHTFVIQGSKKVKITYDTTTWEILSGEEVANFMGNKLQFEPPALQRLLPQEIRSADFDVNFLDDQMRVTSGDRGELRIYVRDNVALGGAEIPDPDTVNTFSS